MSDNVIPRRSKTKIVAVAIAAVFFLLILPGVVLAIASNMTDVELRIMPDKRPAPEYEILVRRLLTEGSFVSLQVAEDTSDKEMKRIVGHVVANQLPAKRKTLLTVYIYTQPPSKTRSRRGPLKSEADQIYLWSLTKGIRRVESGDPSIPKPGPPALTGPRRPF